MKPEETFKHAGYTVRLQRDETPERPEEWMNDDDAFLVAFHRSFGVKYKDFEAADDYPSWEDTHDVLPLFAYIHSGIHLSLAGLNSWDSGQVGWVVLRKQDPLELMAGVSPNEDKAKLMVEVWNQYLSGDIWGYVIEDANGEEVDSLWGMYGLDYCREEAKQSAEGYQRHVEACRKQLSLFAQTFSHPHPAAK